MDPTPNILFISPTVDCYIGGTETVVEQLAQRLKNKAKLTVLSGRPHGKRGGLIRADGYELLTIPFLGRDTRLNQVISKLLMTNRFKIESYSFCRALRNSGIDLAQYDCIVTFYEMDAYLLEKHFPALRERFRHLLPGVALRRFFRRVPARNVFFLGYRAAPRAKRKWGVDIQSLPLGVDSMFFPNAARSFPSSRRLMFVGRLDKSKHADWLVDFFTASGLASRGYQLDIIGDGPLFDAMSSSHGNAAGVVLHGRKRPDEVASLLQQAFLLLHPTGLESFGLTILEGMAAGVPVITHDLDSVKMWAADHPCYAKFLDPAAWGAAIERFEQASYWERVSAQNMAFAQGFTWDPIADQVLRILIRS